MIEIKLAKVNIIDLSVLKVLFKSVFIINTIWGNR